MHPDNGIKYFVSNPSADSEWIEVAQETSAQDNTSIIYVDGNSTFERKARVIIQNYRNNLSQNGLASLEINGSLVSNTLEIIHDFGENQMIINGNGVPNYTPTVMGIEVTQGWNGAVEGGFQSLKFSEDNLGASGGNNPNRVSITNQTFKIPLRPFHNVSITETNLGTVGVALNGVPVFNPFEDPQQTMAYGRIFSSCCGHPAQGGIYHYHKYPTCLRLIEDQWLSEKEKCDIIDSLLVVGGHSPLIGFAIDGWPIYGPVGWTSDMNQTGRILRSSYTGELDASGNPTFVEGSGDLDECNGIISPTPEFPEGIYHYVMSIEANEDGSVMRYINPHFGYDVRNTLKKHSLMPDSWIDDDIYIADLKNGFLINGVQINGTNDFNRFAHFIRRLQDKFNENGMNEVAREFETMKIAYPFTIRKYRGNPSN